MPSACSTECRTACAANVQRGNIDELSDEPGCVQSCQFQDKSPDACFSDCVAAFNATYQCPGAYGSPSGGQVDGGLTNWSAHSEFGQKGCRRGCGTRPPPAPAPAGRGAAGTDADTHNPELGNKALMGLGATVSIVGALACVQVMVKRVLMERKRQREAASRQRNEPPVENRIASLVQELDEPVREPEPPSSGVPPSFDFDAEIAQMLSRVGWREVDSTAAG